MKQKKILTKNVFFKEKLYFRKNDLQIWLCSISIVFFSKTN